LTLVVVAAAPIDSGIVLGLLVIGFIVRGIGDNFNGCGGTVGTEVIGERVGMSVGFGVGFTVTRDSEEGKVIVVGSLVGSEVGTIVVGFRVLGLNVVGLDVIICCSRLIATLSVASPTSTAVLVPNPDTLNDMYLPLCVKPYILTPVFFTFPP
jgi:hypothetical protein